MADLLADSADGAPLHHLRQAHHPDFPVFVPSNVDESDVVSRIFEVVHLNEPSPPTVSPTAPVPENFS